MTPEEIAAMKADNENLKKEIEGLKKPAPKEGEGKDLNKEGEGKEGEDDLDLRQKAAKIKKEQEDKSASTKQIEAALKFDMALNGFVKEHKDILPNEIDDILAIAAKENFDNAIQKAGVIKANILQSFFAVQANVDLLTTNQKAQLDDYLKLTKNGKEQKADSIFDNVFEPALKLLKEVKKAEEIGKSRSGFGTSSKAEDAYKNKLIGISKKAHLGEKGN